MIETINSVLTETIGLDSENDYTLIQESTHIEIHFDERLDLNGTLFALIAALPVGTEVELGKNSIVTIR